MSKLVDEYDNLPPWLQRILPLISASLAIITLSVILFLANKTSLQPVHWLRIVIFSLMGIGFVISTGLLFFRKETAWKWLIGSLSLLPILLMLQLILFIIQVAITIISSIFEGQLPKPIRMFIDNYPSTFDIIILSVLFVIIVLWVIDKLSKRSKEK